MESHGEKKEAGRAWFEGELTDQSILVPHPINSDPTWQTSERFADIGLGGVSLISEAAVEKCAPSTNKEVLSLALGPGASVKLAMCLLIDFFGTL